MIVKRKAFIIKVCVAAIVLSICYPLTLKNIYTTTSKLLPPQKESGGGMSQAGGLADFATGGLSGSADLYIGILKTDVPF